MLNSFINASDCASCKLCCNFCQASAWETPYLDESTVALFQKLNIPLSHRTDGSPCLALMYHTSQPDEVCNCPLLDASNGCKLPRNQRPFECRVWPLRMMYDEQEKLCMACYKHCPALSSPEKINLLIQYALETLLPLMRQYAYNYPKSVRPFHPRYNIIWREQ